MRGQGSCGILYLYEITLLRVLSRRQSINKGTDLENFNQSALTTCLSDNQPKFGLCISFSMATTKSFMTSDYQSVQCYMFAQVGVKYVFRVVNQAKAISRGSS